MDEEKIDWFYGRINGSIKGNYADILNSNPAENFSVKSPEEYKSDKELTTLYKQQFGKGYKQQLDKDIKIAAKDYQRFRQKNFDNRNYSEITLTPGAGAFFKPSSGLKEMTTMPTIYVKSRGRADLSSQSMGSRSVPLRDPRSIHTFDKTQQYYDLEGNAYRMPSSKEVNEDKNWFVGLVETETIAELYNFFSDDQDKTPGMAGMVDNEKYKNKKGKKIIGWAYQTENEYNSGKFPGAGYIAIHENEYLKSTGREGVSYWDAYNKDFKKEADSFDWLGRTLMNGASSLGSIPVNLTAAGAGIFGGNKAVEYYGASLMANQSSEITLSLNSEEAGFLGNWDQTAGLVGDVITQIAGGRIIASGVGAAVKYSLKGLNAVRLANMSTSTIGSAVLKAKNIGGVYGMSLMGANDAYEQALKSGFSAREASALYFGTFGTLIAANKYINVLTKTFTGAKESKVLNQVIQDEINAQAESIKKITEKTFKTAAKEGLENSTKGKIIDNGVAKIMEALNPLKLAKKAISGKVPFKKTVGKIQALAEKSGVVGVAGGMLEESAEETVEFLGQELVNNLFEATKLLTGYTAEGGRVGEMTTIFDPGYFEQFGAGLVQSAVGGGIGGGVMKSGSLLSKKLFKTTDGESTLQDNLVSVVESGFGENYLNLLKSKKEKGELGDIEASTVLDPVTKTYLPMTSAPEGSISMNDAMYEVLAEQYRYVNNVLGYLGTKQAVEKFKVENPTLLDTKKTSLTKDLNSLNREYIDIVINNDIDEQIRPTESLYITSGDTDEDIKGKVEKYAKLANIEEPVAKRLLEIHAEVRDITDGKRTQKYFYEALQKGGILDNTSNAGEFLNEYKDSFGNDVLNNLMNLFQRDLRSKKTDIDEIDKDVEAGNKVIDQLIDKLENGDFDSNSLNNLVTEANSKYFSQERLDKLMNSLNTLNTSPEFAEELKTTIKSQIEDLYSEDNIINTPEYRSLPTDQQKENYVKFFSKLLKDHEFNKIERLQSLNNFFDYAPTALNLRNSTSVGLINMIDTMSSDEYAEEFISKALFSDDLDSLMESTEYNNFLKSLKNNATSLDPYFLIDNKEIISLKVIKQLEKATTVNTTNYKDTLIINALLTGFKKSGDFNLESTASLVTLVNGLIAEQKKSTTENGINTFRDIDKVKSLLYQVKAKLEQARIINQSITPKELSSKDHGWHGVINNFLKTSVFADKEYNKENPLFSNLSVSIKRLKELSGYGFRPQEEEAKFLKYLYKGDLTEEEAQEFKYLNKNELNEEQLLEYKELHTNIKNIELAEAKLLDLEKKLEDLYTFTADNLEALKDADLHFESLVFEVKADEEIVKSLLDLVEGNNPQLADPFREFRDLSIVEGEGRFSKNNIARTVALMEEAKQFLFGLPNKDQLLEEYFSLNINLNIGGVNQIIPEKLIQKYRKAATFLHFDFVAYYAAYKELLEEDLEKFASSTGKQDQAIAGIVSHLITNISDIVLNKFPGAKENNLESAIALLGVQGSGKSSYVLGTALRIAQRIKGLSAKDNNILIASNQPAQLSVLRKTAEKFGLKVNDKSLTSTKIKNKWSPEKLLKLLDSPKKLEGIDTIIYDEITYVQFETYTDPNKISDVDKADLNKILLKVNKINKIRTAENKPLLKLILIGDNTQNGYTTEDGIQKNIGNGNGFLRIDRLLENHRSAVKSMITFVRNRILNRDPETDESLGLYRLDNLESTYGYMEAHGIWGGINFNKAKREDTYNDEFFDNVLKNIEEHKAADLEPFTLGVIFPDAADIDAIDPTSKLGVLIRDYKDNITIIDEKNITTASHDTVQGQEFDYVYAVMSPATIGNSKTSWSRNPEAMEAAAARLLATTIGRARFFAYVVNETDRSLTSQRVDDDITITEPILTQTLLDEYRDLKNNIFDQILAQFGTESKLPELINTVAQNSPTPEELEAERKAEEEKLRIQNTWEQAINRYIEDLELTAGDSFFFTLVENNGNEEDIDGEIVEINQDGIVYKNLVTRVNSTLIFDKNELKVYDSVSGLVVKENSISLPKAPEIELPTAESVINELLAAQADEAMKKELIEADEQKDLLDLLTRFEKEESLSEEELERLNSYKEKYSQLIEEILNNLNADNFENFRQAFENFDKERFNLPEDFDVDRLVLYVNNNINEEELLSSIDDTLEFDTNDEAADYLNENYPELVEYLQNIITAVQENQNKDLEDRLTPQDLVNKINNEFTQKQQEEKELLVEPEPELIIDEREIIDSEETLEEKLLDETLTNEEKEQVEKDLNSIKADQKEVSGDELSEEEKIKLLDIQFGPEFIEAFNNEFLSLKEIEELQEIETADVKKINKLLTKLEKEFVGQEDNLAYIKQLNSVTSNYDRIKEITDLLKKGIRVVGFQYKNKITKEIEYFIEEIKPGELQALNIADVLPGNWEEIYRKSGFIKYYLPDNNELIVYNNAISGLLASREAILNGKLISFDAKTSLVDDSNVEPDLKDLINKNNLVSKINLYKTLSDKTLRSEFVFRLMENNLDTFLVGYLEEPIRRTLNTVAKFEQIVVAAKEYTKLAGFEAPLLNTEDYIRKQLTAIGLIPSIEAFEYRMHYFTTLSETGLKAYNENILLTATDSFGNVVQIGRLLFEMMPEHVKQVYSSLVNPLNPTITIPKDALSLEHVTPGPIIPAPQNVNLTSAKLEELRKENPNIQFSPVMVSTATSIKQEDGSEIENPFRGEGFILYSFGEKIDFENDSDLDTILAKRLSLKTHEKLNHTFANGIGLIRLDNKLFFIKELLEDLKVSSTESKEITEVLNTGKTQRDLGNLFVELIRSNKNEFEKEQPNTEFWDALEAYSDQSIYKVFNNSGSEVEMKIYNGKYLATPLSNKFEEEARQHLNDFIKSALLSGDVHNSFQSRVLIGNYAIKFNEETNSEEPSYKTAIDRKTKTIYKYPEIAKDNSTVGFVLKVLPVNKELAEASSGYRPNAYFNLEQLLALLDEYMTVKNLSDVERTHLYTAIDNIFKSCVSGTLNSGIVARPRIEKIKNTDNLLFARAKITLSEDSLPYYLIKVKEFDLPQLVLDRELLTSVLSNQTDEEEKLLKEALYNKKLTEPLVDEEDLKYKRLHVTKKNKRRKTASAVPTIDVSENVHALLSNIESKENKFYPLFEVEQDLNSLQELLNLNQSVLDNMSLQNKISKLKEHVHILNTNYKNYLIESLDKPLDIKLVNFSPADLEYLDDIELIQFYQSATDPAVKEQIKEFILNRDIDAQDIDPIIEINEILPHTPDQQEVFFTEFKQANPETEDDVVRDYISTLADTQIPSLNGFNEYVDIVNSTSQPNLSDDILNGSLKESVESSLDSLRELVSSLQINAATDISKVKNMMEERVNNLNGILNQFKDANIKERYQEELKEITKELEADLAKLIEEKQDIQEVNSMLPSWSKVPFTLQEQTAIFALYEQSDESTQKLYNEYIKGEDLEDKYLEFYMNFLSRLDDSTQTKFDKC